MGVAFDTRTFSVPNIAAWSTFIVLYLFLRLSRGKDGMADAFRISVKHARASGGRRVNSRPWLARMLIVVGLAIVFTSVVAHTAAFNAEWEAAALMSILRSLGFLMPGFARPWDLEVAERDHAARHSTNRG